VNDRILVVIPTYNERENIGSIVARIGATVPDAHVLIVDDNSPDGTGQIADVLSASDDRVHVLHRFAKEGLGAAYLAGFAWARARQYDVIVECDADGSHQPEQLPRLLAALDTHDVAIGSRWVAGGEVVDWPLSRRLLSRGGSAYARWMLGLSQRDVTGGYRAFRSAALDALGLGRIDSEGYCFQIELLWRAAQAGLHIAEVPITFVERQLGVSKMRGSIVVEAMLRVTMWGFISIRHRPRRQPLAARELTRV
jgi:glycosyltransferase involved in cell wall biosynthesis